ncbi:hypothetical protein I6A84_12605 [Frankia sp. CNm7]|uniref:Dimethylamine monooxygenase subunit DmmA-like C-terminal domain-containing protein n=1 Tax=Frankia nepalensis TaxID=1836974 RepID=A0A937RJ21_9ACTN|nr:dimethylamine monooxygenase subunit DmmA family protein [Frankia nepalensis]MBL7495707.1 hypothetical protein [Frankia nepalensis]MBL7511366.1 hypothetical protein [Frankia nepalensis]MBL7518927.1 hypothetical protein [Frankia nepalensis]MBL7631137.1 hypothetical protein [Frankia nepalensis]
MSAGARAPRDPSQDHSSVPTWAAGPPSPPADDDGAAYVLVGVGPDAEPVLREWRAGLAPGTPVRLLRAADGGEAAGLLAAALTDARVGVRVRVAGPVGACLALRAAALAAGLEDDELYVAPAGAGPVEVACVHCGAVVTAGAAAGDAAAGDVLAGAMVGCPGCGYGLLVERHVSRRTGRFLGVRAAAVAPVAGPAVPGTAAAGAAP